MQIEKQCKRILFLLLQKKAIAINRSECIGQYVKEREREIYNLFATLYYFIDTVITSHCMTYTLYHFKCRQLTLASIVRAQATSSRQQCSPAKHIPRENLKQRSEKKLQLYNNNNNNNNDNNNINNNNNIMIITMIIITMIIITMIIIIIIIMIIIIIIMIIIIIIIILMIFFILNFSKALKPGNIFFQNV